MHLTSTYNVQVGMMGTSSMGMEAALLLQLLLHPQVTVNGTVMMLACSNFGV